jgi:hypothetical protein
MPKFFASHRCKTAYQQMFCCISELCWKSFLRRPEYLSKKTLRNLNIRWKKSETASYGIYKAPGCLFPVGTGYKPVIYMTIVAVTPAGYKWGLAMPYWKSFLPKKEIDRNCG